MTKERKTYHCQQCEKEIYYEGLCWLCRAKQKRKDGLAMTNEDVAYKQKYVISHLDELDKFEDPAYSYFWDCLSYQNVVSEELQQAALDRKMYIPAELYCYAPEHIRDELINRLNQCTNRLEGSYLMSCLAMQGDDMSLEAIYQIKKEGRPWLEDLYAGPEIYAYSGNWSFDENGKRFETGYSKCYEIDDDKDNDNTDKAVITAKVREEKCPHCGSSLIEPISIDCDDERFSFIGAKGRIRAVCCPGCVGFTESAFSSYFDDGTASADLPYEGVADYGFCTEEQDLKEAEEKGAKLRLREVPPFFGAEDWEAATIGGFAHWIQDVQILNCPCCQKPMKYLAQLPWDNFLNGMCEGTLYIEICTNCKKFGMVHQQT